MTPYDDIIDLALVSIEDYRLNKLANYMDEDNFALIKKSVSYNDYVDLCNSDEVTPLKEKDYNKIIDKNFDNYQDYVDDSLSNLALIMESFMIRGLPNFTNCKQDLSKRDDEQRTFLVLLTDLEKSIIADWTVIKWFEKEIHDIRQVVGMLANKTEGNRYSEANLLDKKMLNRVQLQEDVSRKQTEYDFLNIPWSDWAGGNYGV